MEYNQDQINFMAAVERHRSAGYHYCYDGEDLGFSSTCCNVCGSRLAGDRYRIVEYNPISQHKIDLKACIDCTVYIANSDVPETWVSS